AGVINLKLDEAGIRNTWLRKPGGIAEFYGTRAAGLGLGGSALAQTISNTTIASIDATARVRTGAAGVLLVKADEEVNTIEIAEAAGKSGLVGVSGTVSRLVHQSVTRAEVVSGAILTGGAVDVTAHSDANHTSILGGVQVARSVGAGVTVGVTEIGRVVEAVIGRRQSVFQRESVDGALDSIAINGHGFATGDEVVYRNASGSDAALGGLTSDQHYFVIAVDGDHFTLAATAADAVAGLAIGLDPDSSSSYHMIERAGAVGSGSTINVASIALNASATGAILSVSVAGAVASNSPVPTNGNLSATQTAQLAVAKNAFALAGDVAVNTEFDVARAYINDPGTISVAPQGALSLTAENTTNIRSVAGAASGAQASFGVAVGLAGSSSNNLIKMMTGASIDEAVIDRAGIVTLSATRRGEALAIAASLSAGSGVATGAITGSSALNNVDTWTRADVLGAHVTASQLDITATDTSKVIAGAGGLAGGKSGLNPLQGLIPSPKAAGLALGVSVGTNSIHSEIGASVRSQSTVSLTGHLMAEAIAAGTAEAYTFGGSVMLGALSAS
ncbi:MAG: hypothetical protein Q7J75_02665, partial [Rhodoferax sp.]|nr:hypothetical protein [Rhodoferax sp.]